MLHLRLLLLSSAALAVSLPRDARACSCAAASIERRSFPRDGAVQFPVDGRVRVLVTGGLPERARAGLVREYRLRDAAGRLVPLDARVDGTLLTFAPRAPLAPGSRYVLERAFAYDERGERLSDDERWQATWRKGARGVARRAWFAESSFTTGDGGAVSPPVAPVTVGARIHLAFGGGDCGPGSAISVRFRATPRADDLLGLEIEGRGVVATFALDPTRRDEAGDLVAYAGNMLCTPDPVRLELGEDMHVRIVALSARGEKVGAPRFTAVELPGPDVLARVVAPALTRGSDADGARDAAQASAFLGTRTPLDDGPVAVAQVGPRACPHGVESESIAALPAGTLPWMSGDQPSIGGREGTSYTLYLDERAERAELIALDARGRVTRTPLSGPGSGAVAAFGLRAFITAAVVNEGEVLQTSVQVSRFDYAGKLAWATPLGGTGLDWHPRVVWTNTRVLAAWRSDARQVRYAVLDAKSGAIVGGGEVPAPGHDVELAISVTSRDPPFAMTWSLDRDTVAWAHVQADGALDETRTLPAPRVRGLALHPTPRGMVLAIAADALRVMSIEDDHLAPTRVDTGVGAPPILPSLAAWPDGTLFLAWRAGDRGYVTALDTEGNVASATALADGGALTIPRLLGVRDGVLAVYAAGEVNWGTQPRLERLRCARAPRGGAPERIGGGRR